MSERIAQQLKLLAHTEVSRRELLANVSHDLRTPLASMQGYLETLLLKHGTIPLEEERGYLEVAAKHSNSPYPCWRSHSPRSLTGSVWLSRVLERMLLTNQVNAGLARKRSIAKSRKARAFGEACRPSRCNKFTGKTAGSNSVRIALSRPSRN